MGKGQRNPGQNTAAEVIKKLQPRILVLPAKCLGRRRMNKTTGRYPGENSWFGIEDQIEILSEYSVVSQLLIWRKIIKVRLTDKHSIMGMNNSCTGSSSALSPPLSSPSPSSSPSSLPPLPSSSPSSPPSSPSSHHHVHQINPSLAEDTTFYIILLKAFSPNLRIGEAIRNQFEPNSQSVNHAAHNETWPYEFHIT